MSRLRRYLFVAAAAAFTLAAGCRTTDPCCCEPPREGLLSRLGLRPGGGRCCSGPVIGTTVSGMPITSGGVYPGALGAYPEGYGYSGAIEGPILPATPVPPYGTVPPPPAAGTLPPPMPVPGDTARPIPADPSRRRIG
jgi:hypothetical protein